MRLRALRDVKKLSDKFCELCPSAQYVSVSTTYQGIKGRFTGFKLDNDAKVGIFVKSHTNFGKIISTGTHESPEYFNPFIDILKGEGYSE